MCFQETLLRQRQNALMEHPFFLLDVRLQEGKDLVVRDSCGECRLPVFLPTDSHPAGTALVAI